MVVERDRIVSYLSSFLAFSDTIEQFLIKHLAMQIILMVPEKRFDLLSKLKNKNRSTENVKRKREEYNLEDIADTIYQCRKCGSRKIDMYQLQTRGCDEASHIVIHDIVFKIRNSAFRFSLFRFVFCAAYDKFLHVLGVSEAVAYLNFPSLETEFRDLKVPLDHLIVL